MNSKTHNTALVVIPPENVWPAIQAIRREHDRQFRRWMPHITLLYPFRPREEFGALAPRIEAACAELGTFEIRLSVFRFFEHSPDRCTIWLAPDPAEALAHLHESLWRAAPDCDDVRRHASGFTPHLSVGQARGQAAAMKLAAELQAAWKPIVFPVSEIHFIWRNDPPDDIFRSGRRLPLLAAHNRNKGHSEENS